MSGGKKFITCLFFLAAIGLAVGADSFRNVNNGEWARFSFQFREKAQQVVTIDLARQGMLKYYLQPGTITLYGTGKNMPSEVNLYAVFSGEAAFLSQGSKKGIWRSLTADMPLQPNQRGNIPLNIEVDIPYKQTRQYEVGNAVLEFRQGDQQIQSIHFRFINSRYAIR